MFLNPFTFDPPDAEVLTRAVESYQRVAAARFFNYRRKAENRGLLPLNVTGDTLEPTPRQLYLEVRSLRHLTAIQKTLRDFGGPLFNPASPIPPGQRFQLVERRLEAVEQTLADPDDPFSDALYSSEADPSSSSNPVSSSPSPSSSRSSDFDHPVNHVSSSSPSSSFYYPPEIEDLLAAVDDAQHVFAARADLLDKRHLRLSPEDFAWEILAMRDLTAIIRTLRRMSARQLPEDEPLTDAPSEESSSESPSPNPVNPVSSSLSSLGSEPARHSLGEVGSTSSASCSSPPNPVHPVSSSSSSSPSPSSNPRGGINPVNQVSSPSSVPRIPEVRAIKPRNSGAPAQPETPRSPARVPARDSEISNLKSEIPNPQSEIPATVISSNHANHVPSLSSPVLHDKDPP